MPEILRSVRLGLINLLGITVPGLLLLILVLVGLAPVILIIQHACCLFGLPVNALNTSSLPTAAAVGPGVLLGLLLTFAYVIGYIFRLITPDDLDRISGNHVLRRMPPERIGKEGDAWPYRGDKDDVFPYYYFSEYLERRGHDKLLHWVKWGPPTPGKLFRSKTHVNKMKVETSLISGDLAAVIESNEAHIRMLSGVWRAVNLSLRFQYIGVGVCLSGFVLVALRLAPAVPVAYITDNLQLGLMVVVAIAGCLWARNIIEHLFHYRRVRELMDIVVCRSLADQVATEKVAAQRAAETAGLQVGQGSAPCSAAPVASPAPVTASLP